jgi:hypothetical protein
MTRNGTVDRAWAGGADDPSAGRIEKTWSAGQVPTVRPLRLLVAQELPELLQVIEAQHRYLTGAPEGLDLGARSKA